MIYFYRAISVVGLVFYFVFSYSNLHISKRQGTSYCFLVNTPVSLNITFAINLCLGYNG